MDYIFKPMSYVLVILLGYLLKRAGFFGQDDHRMMSRIMVNITLPCTIVQAFDGFERDAGMFVIVGIGLLCAFVPILLMYLTTGGVEKRLRAYRMLNIGGYNIGCFSLPLVQAFFGKRPRQGRHDVILTDDRLEIVRAPLARQNLIRTHAFVSPAARRASPSSRQMRQSSCRRAPSFS